MNRFIFAVLFIAVMITGNIKPVVAEQPQEALILAEVMDSTYDFSGKGITFNTVDLRFFLGQPTAYRSAFGIFDPETGSPLVRTFSTTDIGPEAKPSFTTAFQKQSDGSFTVMVVGHLETDRGLEKLKYYVWLSEEMEIKEIFSEFKKADHHGMLITRDGKGIYHAPIYTIEDFSVQNGPDSIRTETFDLRIYDPETKLDTILWSFRNTFDNRFILKENMFEGLLDKNTIDWSHPNSIYEDRDGDLLYGTRHVGVGILDRTGNVKAWFGVPQEKILEQGMTVLRELSPGDYLLRRSHDFHQILNGPLKGYYAIYDNGDESREHSRVVVFDIDKNELTIDLKFEHRFPYSPFMGSVDFLEDGTYLVNVPYAPISTKRIVELGRAGHTDSLDYYMKGSGSILYWMTVEGDTIAKYTTRDLNYIYSARVTNLQAWPDVQCVKSGNHLELTPSYNDGEITWYNGNEALGNEFKIVVPSEYRDIYYTFKQGIATGYSKKINPANCR